MDEKDFVNDAPKAYNTHMKYTDLLTEKELKDFAKEREDDIYNKGKSDSAESDHKLDHSEKPYKGHDIGQVKELVQRRHRHERMQKKKDAPVADDSASKDATTTDPKADAASTEKTTETATTEKTEATSTEKTDAKTEDGSEEKKEAASSEKTEAATEESKSDAKATKGAVTTSDKAVKNADEAIDKAIEKEEAEEKEEARANSSKLHGYRKNAWNEDQNENTHHVEYQEETKNPSGYVRQEVGAAAWPKIHSLHQHRSK